MSINIFYFLILFNFFIFIVLNILFDHMTEYYQDISFDLQKTEPFLPLVLPDSYNENLSLIKNIEQKYQYLHQFLRRKDRLIALIMAYYIRKAIKEQHSLLAKRSLY